MTYVLNDHGEIVESNESFSGGRFRMIEGKLVRVGDSRAIPDRPYSTKGAFDSPVLNHLDGKYYTNMSSYEDAVKAKGGKILGNDAPTKAATVDKPINWQKAVSETINSLPQRKGK